MTAKFLNNYPAKNALRIISQNRKFVIITSILFLLGIPLIAFTGLLEGYLSSLEQVKEDYTTYFSCEAYVAIGCFCAGIAVFMGMFCGIRAFEEEWSKTRVDMLYALPLNGTQRFFSNYLGGLIMYIVPYLISVLLGWIICLIMIPMITALDGSFAEEIKEIYSYYFLGSFGLGVLMWMYYSISALTASCCGTMFENIYTNLLLNLLIPGTFAAVLGIVTNEVSGLDFEYSWDFIGYMSPIGGLIYLVYLFEEKDSSFFNLGSYSSTYEGYGGAAENSGFIPAYVRWIVVIILLTAGLTVFAWKLYQKRKAEHVGKPFVYIWIYYVILTAVTICILCVADVEDDAAIAAIIFSAIVYFIMEVIRKRGFKKFWLSAVTYVVTVVTAFGLFFLTVTTDCFGRTKYIPAVASITSVELQFNSIETSRGTSYHLIYKDKETISAIRNFHKEYLDNHDTLGTQLQNLAKEYHYDLRYDYDTMNNGYEFFDFAENVGGRGEYYCNHFPQTDFSVTYHTIAGTTIHRSYQIYPDEYFNLMQFCIGTEAYTQANANLLKNRLLSEYRNYNQKTHSYEIPYQCEMNVYYFTDQNFESRQEFYISDTENSIQKLKDAYQQDMQNFTFEHYQKDRILCYLEDMPIYESLSGTVSILKDWGFQEFHLADILANSMQNSSSSYNQMEMQIIAPENYSTGSLHYPSWLPNTQPTILFKNQVAYEDILPIMSDSELKQYAPDIAELFNCARINYLGNERCYLLVINGKYYFIQEQNSNIVEKFIQKDNFYYQNQLINSNFASYHIF